MIDTNDVQFSVVWPKDAQTRAYLRGRTEAIILRGDAKVAFDAWAEGDAPSCQTCTVFDDDEERCTWTIGHVAFPKCYEEREEAAPKPLCKTCASYNVASGHCDELAGGHYPECWGKREEGPAAAADDLAACRPCRYYDAMLKGCREHDAKCYPTCREA